MQDTCLCTVVTSNYLHFALALSRSIQRYHSGLKLVVCVVDRKQEITNIKEPQAEFVFADEIGIPDFRRFAFQYSAFELACALKPSVMRHCLTTRKANRVIYLDADIKLFGTLDELATTINDASIILTPHLLAPLPDDGLLPNYQTLAMAGAYNAGFLCVTRSEAGWAFLRWWEDMLRKWCIVKPTEGFFVDQLLLDLVPGLFEKVYIHRRPGFHVGYWNLSGEQIHARGDGYCMQRGQPLTLFHFSGLDLSEKTKLSKHQTRLQLSEFPVVSQLVNEYALCLENAGRLTFERWDYGFDTLCCGTSIQPEWRQAVRLGHAEFASIKDPFDSALYGLPNRYLRFVARSKIKPSHLPRKLLARLQDRVSRLYAQQ